MKKRYAMKKILALILALAMVLSLSSAALAAEEPEQSTPVETAEVSESVEESPETQQVEETEEESAPEESQQDEEAEVPAQEEAQSEEAAEAEESAQETPAEEPEEDADESLAPQDDDEDMEYKWKVYKKFLEYQKEGKTVDFAYHYDVNGFTVEMTPAGNGKFNAVINGKGVCDSGYDHMAVFEFIDSKGKKTTRSDYIGYERCGVDPKKAPDSIKTLLSQLNASKASDKYLMPEINRLTFGSGISSLKEVDGFFGYDKIRNMTIPGTVKKIGSEVFSELVFQTDDKAHKADHYDADWSAWGYKLVYHNFDSVTFQNGIEEIGEKSFMKATIKNGIKLPASVKTIRDSAFSTTCVSYIEVDGDVNLGSDTFNSAVVTGGKVVFHGNVKAGSGNFSAIKGVSRIVFEKNYKSTDGLWNFSSSPELKEILVGGNATFSKNEFDDLPKLNKISVGGNATFATSTFSKGLVSNPKKSAPDKLIVGGDACFNKDFAPGALNGALSEVTVKGDVTSKKDAWKGTPYEKSGVKSHGTTKAPKTKKTPTPSATKLTSVKYKKNKNPKKSTTTVKWKRNAKGTGYQLQYSTDKKFKKAVKTINIKKNKVSSKTIKGMEKGKYFFRIRVTGKKGAKSKWSKVKNLVVKK